jgi:hypothetical protein
LSEDSLSSTVVKMERRYGNEEYADMHFMHGKANGNALEAARLCQEAFPHRRQPNSRTFTRVHQRLREQGSFTHGGRAGRPKTPDVEERVLQRAAQSPGTSTRRIAAQERESQQCVENFTSPAAVPLPPPTHARSHCYGLPSQSSLLPV